MRTSNPAHLDAWQAAGVPTPDLAHVLRLAATGVFPAADGGWDRVEPWRAGTEAVVALTGHAYLAVAEDVGDDELAALAPDGTGGAHHPRVVSHLAGGGRVDVLDALLATTGGGDHRAAVVRRDDLGDHPRAAYARTVRDEVRVLGRPDAADTSLMTVARGVAGLTELGVETSPGTDGAALLADVVAVLPRYDPVLAAVAPGNARALRSILRAGFRPLGSVQLYRPSRWPDLTDTALTT